MNPSEKTGTAHISTEFTVARRVLVIHTGRMLEEGLEMLLARYARFQVSRISFQPEDETDFVQAVSTVHPDVIVLNGDSSLDFSQMIKLLGEALGSAPFMVITVWTDSNYIDIYERRNVLLTDSQDFLKALNARHLSD